MRRRVNALARLREDDGVEFARDHAPESVLLERFRDPKRRDTHECAGLDDELRLGSGDERAQRGAGGNNDEARQLAVFAAKALQRGGSADADLPQRSMTGRVFQLVKIAGLEAALRRQQQVALAAEVALQAWVEHDGPVHV